MAHTRCLLKPVVNIKKLKKKEKEVCEPFLDELRLYKKKRIKILIDGEEKNLTDIAYTVTVLSVGLYYGRFVKDADGKVKELRFEPAKEKEERLPA